MRGPAGVNEADLQLVPSPTKTKRTNANRNNRFFLLMSAATRNMPRVVVVLAQNPVQCPKIQNQISY